MRKETNGTQKISRSWSYYRISSFSWSKFEFIIFFTCLMFLRIPEASNAFKWMFFDALEIQEPSQIDPWSIWERSFFHQNLHFFEIFRPVVNDGFDEIYQLEFSKSCIYHWFHRVRSIWRSLWFFYRLDFSKNWDMYPKLEAGGKPSTWFPPGRLVEHIFQTEMWNRNKKDNNKKM